VEVSYCSYLRFRLFLPRAMSAMNGFSRVNQWHFCCTVAAEMLYCTWQAENWGLDSREDILLSICILVCT